MVAASSDIWVFAYGSLMWRPGFSITEARRATLTGWHRRLCIVSRHYRGTAEWPGLLLGLDCGGSCEGVAFRVAADDVASVLKYLRAREQISGVYRETHLPVELHGEPRERCRALAFLAEHAHPSFVRRRLSVTAQARIVATASGSTGSNLAYLSHTTAELTRMAIREPELERVLAMIGIVRARRLAASTGRLHPQYLGRRPGTRLGPRARIFEVKRFGHRSRMG